MASSSGVSMAEKVAAKVTDTLKMEFRESKDFPSIITSQPTIWKISSDIRGDFDDAYVPKLVPIGPFHRRRMEEDVLQKAKQLKQRYVQDLLDRDPENDLENYALAIALQEMEVRQRYSEQIDLTSEDLVKLMVIDGCFVVEFLLKYAEGMVGKPLTAHKSDMRMLRNDLLLMENQIPWFILDTILTKTRHNLLGDVKDLTILDLGLFFLHMSTRKDDMLIKGHWIQVDGLKEVYHLLHLSLLCLLQGLTEEEDTRTSPLPKTLNARVLRWLKDSTIRVVCGLFHMLKKVRGYLSWILVALLYFIVSLFELLIIGRLPSWLTFPSKKSSLKSLITVRDRGYELRVLPTATELKDCGIYFKRKENARCSLDVSFKDGTLEMGRVSIDGSSQSIFRNLLALEQSLSGVGKIFTSYVVLMDNLIDTAADVALLKRVGVIESKLGSDQDVANFFNGLRSGMFFTYRPHELFVDVNEYYRKDHNRWRAKLMHDYFSNPWAIFSVFAAIILLVLTATQTIYGILSFNRDKAQNA